MFPPGEWSEREGINSFGQLVRYQDSRYGMEQEPQEGYVLMQSTGLTDKNGKEIFESDIVQTTLAARKTIAVIEWEQPEVRYDYEGQYSDLNGFVRFAGWRLKGKLPIAMHEGNCEVIGNIWENPELLPSINNGN